MRTAKTIILTMTCVAAGLGLSLQAWGLEPTKASQIITVVSDSIGGLGQGGASAECIAGNSFLHKVDKQQNLDGTGKPFVIPAGHVFIVTSYEWSAERCAPLAPNGVELVALDSTGTRFSLVSVGSAMSDNGGNVAGTSVVPSGVVVKADTNFCAGACGGFTLVIVHGFLAKDN